MRTGSTRMMLGLTVGLLGCEGSISVPGQRQPVDPVGPPGSPARSVWECAVGKAVTPGAAPMRRLTHAEYERTVRALTGVDVSSVVSSFPADIRADGFDNFTSTQSISTLHADRYFAAAQAVGDQVATNAAVRATVVGCDVQAAASRAQCLSDFVDRFGRRVYRRPLTPTERDTFLTLAATETDGLMAASVVVQAMLQSPKFLFRPEAEAVGGPRALTAFEVASRLSFFLWGEGPDDALLADAEMGRLDSRDGVVEVAREMLTDPRARDAMARFSEQWLQVARLDKVRRSAVAFPSFGPQMVRSMQAELSRRTADAMWSGRDVFELFTSRNGYVDGQLAPIYGLTAPVGSGLQQVEVPADRAGLLGSAGWLAMTTRNDATSLVQRGAYVRQVLLCEGLSPPANIPQLEAMPGEEVADAEKRHAADPQCAGCHKRLDPVGEGLERFDALGALRTQYASGAPVSMHGRIEGLMPADFQGAAELGSRLRDAQQARSCFATKVFRFAYGRLEQPATDACGLRQLDLAFADAGHRFPELLASLVSSDAFLTRGVEP